MKRFCTLSALLMEILSIFDTLVANGFIMIVRYNKILDFKCLNFIQIRYAILS